MKSFEVINAGAILPGAEVPGVAVACDLGRCLGSDFEFFPFALQHAAVKLEIFSG
jgi:hypothetical protein